MKPTAASYARKFGYCFETPPGSEYPAIVQATGCRRRADNR